MGHVSDVADAVIRVLLGVRAGESCIGAFGLVVPGRRDWRGVAFASGGSEETVDRVVSEVAVERIGAEQRMRMPLSGVLSWMLKMLPARSYW
jgi:hypothetical protein